jgi:hypothetical protein
MTTSLQARIAGNSALKDYRSLFGVRPRSVGIVYRNGVRWLRIVLPREAARMPATVCGVSAEYAIADAPAQAAQLEPAPWAAAAGKWRAGG